MRCFIVGGSDLACGWTRRDEAGAVVSGELSLLRLVSLCCTAAEAVVVIRPSAVHSARKAVTMTVQSFMTLFLATVPHFRVGRFAYFPHDVYERDEVVDRRPWRVDVQMNTTRMGARGVKMRGSGEKRSKSPSVRVSSPSGRIGEIRFYSAGKRAS